MDILQFSSGGEIRTHDLLVMSQVGTTRLPYPAIFGIERSRCDAFGSRSSLCDRLYIPYEGMRVSAAN